PQFRASQQMGVCQWARRRKRIAYSAYAAIARRLQQRPQYCAKHVYVLMTVEMGDRNSRLTQLFDLRSSLRFDFGGIQPHAASRARELQEPNTKAAVCANERRDPSLGQQRRAVYQHNVATDAKRRLAPRHGNGGFIGL